jgi:L-cystine uptake protein TcyP (sodium:dicarboxylate symporter family)
MNIDTSALDPKALSTYADNAHKLQGGGIGGFILNIIPTTSIDALSRNDVLQVLFFAVLFGVALALVGEKGEKVTSLIDAVSTVLFLVMGSERSPTRLANTASAHSNSSCRWSRSTTAHSRRSSSSSSALSCGLRV